MQGGSRERKRIKRGDQALLAAIWDLHGGPTEVARKIIAYSRKDLNLQAPINWRIRGKVPYNYVKVVAEALNINPAGLNYSTLSRLTDDIPSWEEVVKSYGLSKGVVDMILFLRPPDIKGTHGQ